MAPETHDTSPERSRPPTRRGSSSAWNLLLIIPLVGVLIPSFYNFTDPSIGGMPFFYWYQLLWVPLSVICTYVTYRQTYGSRR